MRGDRGGEGYRGCGKRGYEGRSSGHDRRRESRAHHAQNRRGEEAMKVPFLDLRAQYETIKDEIATAIQQVLDKTAFAGGPFVQKFEGEFAAFCGTKFCAGVGNGTDALWMALLALGIGPGDEVITVPDTFIATAEAISFCGAKPVFVDVDPVTYNMDPGKIERAITPRAKIG